MTVGARTALRAFVAGGEGKVAEVDGGYSAAMSSPPIFVRADATVALAATKAASAKSSSSFAGDRAVRDGHPPFGVPGKPGA